MAIGKMCAREVTVAGRDTTVEEAARMMRRFHVGDLIVIDKSEGDEAAGKPKPVGIVTDRDIVLAVVATGLDPSVFTLGDLAMHAVQTCPQELGVFECIQLMRIHGVRRMPVVDADGALTGVVSVDDILRLLAEELAELSKVVAHQQAVEVESRR